MFRGLTLQGFRGLGDWVCRALGVQVWFLVVCGGGYLCRLLSLRFWVRVLDVVFRQDLNRIQKPGPEILQNPETRKAPNPKTSEDRCLSSHLAMNPTSSLEKKRREEQPWRLESCSQKWVEGSGFRVLGF